MLCEFLLNRELLSHQRLCALAYGLECKTLFAGLGIAARYVLEQCFSIMFGGDISLVFRKRLMFVITLCCFDVMALYAAGEREREREM